MSHIKIKMIMLLSYEDSLMAIIFVLILYVHNRSE